MATKPDNEIRKPDRDRKLEQMNRLLRDCIAEARRLSERAHSLVRKYQEMVERRPD